MMEMEAALQMAIWEVWQGRAIRVCIIREFQGSHDMSCVHPQGHP